MVVLVLLVQHTCEFTQRLLLPLLLAHDHLFVIVVSAALLRLSPLLDLTVVREIELAFLFFFSK